MLNRSRVLGTGEHLNMSLVSEDTEAIWEMESTAKTYRGFVRYAGSPLVRFQQMTGAMFTSVEEEDMSIGLVFYLNPIRSRGPVRMFLKTK